VVLPEAVPRISIGPITSQTLREAGMPAHAEAKEASVAGLAEAVAGWLKQAQG
jgi:uroporphyrinogen-III synthase